MFKNDAKTHAITNIYLSKFYREKKTKNLPRTTIFGKWSFNKGIL